jgi:hypothetical protein
VTTTTIWRARCDYCGLESRDPKDLDDGNSFDSECWRCLGMVTWQRWEVTTSWRFGWWTGLTREQAVKRAGGGKVVCVRKMRRVG